MHSAYSITSGTNKDECKEQQLLGIIAIFYRLLLHVYLRGQTTCNLFTKGCTGIDNAQKNLNFSTLADSNFFASAVTPSQSYLVLTILWPLAGALSHEPPSCVPRFR
jgi:hypothetical protein